MDCTLERQEGLKPLAVTPNLGGLAGSRPGRSRAAFRRSGNFAVQSQASVLNGERVVARWSEGVWPEAGFFDVMNAAVVEWTIGPDQIVLDLENGLSLRLVDDSEQYESMQIRIGDDLWVI